MALVLFSKDRVYGTLLSDVLAAAQRVLTLSGDLTVMYYDIRCIHAMGSQPLGFSHLACAWPDSAEAMIQAFCEA